MNRFSTTIPADPAVKLEAKMLRDRAEALMGMGLITKTQRNAAWNLHELRKLVEMGEFQSTLPWGSGMGKNKQG